jgi:polysaccharide pyruvyl transferase WcaK-like protein
MMARATAILLNDTTNWYHWGCTATSIGLKSIISERYDLVDTVPIRATYTLASSPNSPAEFHDPKFFGPHASENADLYARIRQVDCVFVHGEGTIHGLKRPTINLLYMSYAARRYLDKPVYLVNHSVYPQTGRPGEDSAAFRFYQSIYAAFDYVAVRETRSKQTLDRLGIPATQAFDCLPLTTQGVFPETPQKQRTLAIAGSIVIERSAMPALVAFANEMRPHYRPVVITGAQADPAEEDSRFVTDLRSLDAHDWNYVEAKSLEEWLSAIGTADLLVSGRFHHTLAAFAMGTPFVMLNSNTPKMSALAAMLGTPEPIRYVDPNLESLLATRSQAALSEDFARAVFDKERRRTLLDLSWKNLPPA